MSISPIVDAEYRILPTDLEGHTRRVEIANVTYQGVEAMTPVLHFVGQTKRLVMTPEHAKQMLEITGSILHAQWIGVTIILQPRITKQESRILIHPVSRKRRGQPMPIYVLDDRRGWLLALSIVGILLAISLTLANIDLNILLDTFLTTLQQLRDNWPLR